MPEKAFLALAIGLALTGSAFGHGLVAKIELAEPAVVVMAKYDTGEPAGNCDIEIYSAALGPEPYHFGRTDPGGAFAFVPNETGEWTVVVDDGFGHRVDKPFQVDWSGTAQSDSSPPLERVFTGLSAILGLTGLALWWKTRKQLEQVESA